MLAGVWHTDILMYLGYNLVPLSFVPYELDMTRQVDLIWNIYSDLDLETLCLFWRILLVIYRVWWRFLPRYNLFSNKKVIHIHRVHAGGMPCSFAVEFPQMKVAQLIYKLQLPFFFFSYDVSFQALGILRVESYTQNLFSSPKNLRFRFSNTRGNETIWKWRLGVFKRCVYVYAPGCMYIMWLVI